MHHRSRVAVDDAGHVVKRSTDVDVRNVDVPMPVGSTGLIESCTFGFRLARFTAQKIRRTENAIDGSGTDGDDICVEHHVRQATITIQRMLEMKLDDGVFFPIFEPVITRDRTVMLVRDAVAAHPLVESGFIQTDQAKELLVADFSTLGPVVDEVDY